MTIQHPRRRSTDASWRRRSTIGVGIGGWVMAVLLGLDQFANAVTGGDPDMTISTRCGLKIVDGSAGWPCRVTCWALEFVDADHCADAVE